MKGDLWTIAIVLVFLAMLLPAVNLGFEGAATEEVIEDEQVTLEYQNAIEVEYNETAAEDPEEVTLVDSNGNELDHGTDYEWDSGAITTLQEEFDGENADVTYPAETHTEETKDVSQILGVFDGWIAILFLFVVVGAIIAMAFGGSSFGGGRY